MMHVKVLQLTPRGYELVDWFRMDSLPLIGHHIGYGAELEVKKIVHHYRRDSLGHLAIDYMEIFTE